MHMVSRYGIFCKVIENGNFTKVAKQGDYSSIKKWILHGEIDFGFVNSDVVSGINMEFLYRDEMMAVLPKHHKLAKESFILLDEGRHSVIMHAFADYKLEPQIEYKVYGYLPCIV